MDEDDERVSVEISLAENVYVTIKTSVKGYDDVLKDARDIAKELNDLSLDRSAFAFSSLFLFQQGRFSEVIENYEKIAPAVVRFPKTRTGRRAALVTGCAYAFSGNTSYGMGMLLSLKNDATIEDPFIHCLLVLAMGTILIELNRLDEALANLKAAHEKAIAGNYEIV